MSTYLNVIPDGRQSPSRDEIAMRLRINTGRLNADIRERSSLMSRLPSDAGEFIAYEFKILGCEVQHQKQVLDGLFYQYIEAELTGNERSEDVLVIGVRYDVSLERHGKNGESLACLFEIAEGLIGLSNRRTIRLVVFINEGPQRSVTPFMEKYLYLENAISPREKFLGMITLDIPHCNNERNTTYSDGFTSETGVPHVTLLGDVQSHGLMTLVEQALHRSCDIPVRTMFAPGSEGVTITVNRISYAFLAEIAEGITGAVFELSGDT